MQVSTHPAARGLFWLTDGLRILGKQPFLLMLITLVAFIVMLMTMGVRTIGPLISMTLMPAVYVGWMRAIRACDDGEVPTASMLFYAFRSDAGPILKPLISLGLINAALVISAQMLALALAPGDALVLENAQDPGGPEAPKIDIMWLLVLLALFMTIQMALWYAPLIIAWHHQPVLKSIFFSLIAFWRNKWAFATLFAAWLCLATACIFVVQTVAAALSLSTTVAQYLSGPAILFLFTVLQCSFWVTYRDVFDPPANRQRLS